MVLQFYGPTHYIRVSLSVYLTITFTCFFLVFPPTPHPLTHQPIDLPAEILTAQIIGLQIFKRLKYRREFLVFQLEKLDSQRRRPTVASSSFFFGLWQKIRKCCVSYFILFISIGRYNSSKTERSPLPSLNCPLFITSNYSNTPSTCSFWDVFQSATSAGSTCDFYLFFLQKKIIPSFQSFFKKIT